MEGVREVVTEGEEEGLDAQLIGFIVPGVWQEEAHPQGKGLERPGEGQ